MRCAYAWCSRERQRDRETVGCQAPHFRHAGADSPRLSLRWRPPRGEGRAAEHIGAAASGPPPRRPQSHHMSSPTAGTPAAEHKVVCQAKLLLALLAKQSCSSQYAFEPLPLPKCKSNKTYHQRLLAALSHICLLELSHPSLFGKASRRSTAWSFWLPG